MTKRERLSAWVSSMTEGDFRDPDAVCFFRGTISVGYGYATEWLGGGSYIHPDKEWRVFIETGREP